MSFNRKVERPTNNQNKYNRSFNRKVERPNNIQKNTIGLSIEKWKDIIIIIRRKPIGYFTDKWKDLTMIY